MDDVEGIEARFDARSLRAVLEGLPDATVASARDGRIVFVNTLAEELFGFKSEELIGKHVSTIWPERVRERYTRNMDLYFATEHPLRFSSEAWGLRRDGTEFVGEMSWGIVETVSGPLLLAIGRDISERRAAEMRLRAVAAMGERALAGADPRRPRRRGRRADARHAAGLRGRGPARRRRRAGGGRAVDRDADAPDRRRRGRAGGVARARAER